MRHVVAVLALASIVVGQDATDVVFPAFTGFAHPDPNGVRRSDDGTVRRWSDTLCWYGWIAQHGELVVTLELGTVDTACTLELAVDAMPTENGPRRTRTVDVGAATVTFDPFPLESIGYHRLTLRCVDGRRPPLTRVRLGGDASRDARFSSVERRNAASVHLGYEVPEAVRDDVAWFYCEVTPRTDPLWTYYMATGWRRGYFGMQVNSPTERRVIFSVWDAGNEAVDRAKVAADDRVQLVAKGEQVVAEDFGNEGTGGHSHQVVPWRLGQTFRFLVHAAADGTHTTYTGWFWSTTRNDWDLIASFRAPRDGRLLHGLYSFNENFSGANGDARRDCEFGNQWVRSRGGDWVPLTVARFTHDGHGQSERTDRSAGVRGDRFYLANGGFVIDPAPDAVTTAHARLERVRATDAAGPPERLPVPPNTGGE